MAARGKRRAAARRPGARAPAAERSRGAARSEDPGYGAYSSPACYLHEFEEPPATAAQESVSRHGVGIKRIYEEPAPADGYRALIDRLWPRGITRQRAALDAWLIELAPSNALRLWYGHDPQRWSEFGRRYRAELRDKQPLLAELRARAARQRVTLLYGAREPRINHAVVLREVLLGARRQRRSRD
jgi:uncharacterized protein YeaO (DUF488 family)